MIKRLSTCKALRTGSAVHRSDIELEPGVFPCHQLSFHSQGVLKIVLRAIHQPREWDRQYITSSRER
jgi:hypothetical protein